MDCIEILNSTSSKRQFMKFFNKLPILKLYQQNLMGNYRSALFWLKNHVIHNKGIQISNKQPLPYPEVSGYYIPTLLLWGERNLAMQFAKWLVSIQKQDGSWTDPENRSSYIFDTGQILKGLIALVDSCPEFQEPIIRGCDWLIRQRDSNGRLITPDTSQWHLPGGKTVPEAIHLYALEPVKKMGVKWGLPSYIDAIEQSSKYYLCDCNLTKFHTLSHFHAYIVEALVDLGHEKQAIEGMRDVAAYQNRRGAIPAYTDVNWICSVGLFQYALIWYKMGDLYNADQAFNYACSLQNKSGGFYGSYGCRANYFPEEEISWVIKYFLDALWWKIKTSFDSSVSDFPDAIDYNDGRYHLVVQEINNTKSMTVLDMGCGKGRFIKRIKEECPKIEAYGLDLSAKMLASLPEDIKPVQGSLLNIPFKDEYCDFAFCIEALEHAVNQKLAIHEMSRVIKPGGTLIIIDKNKKLLGRLSISPWEQWFSEDEITLLLRQEGLTVHVQRNIPYDGCDGRDGLFLGWIARKPQSL